MKQGLTRRGLLKAGLGFAGAAALGACAPAATPQVVKETEEAPVVAPEEEIVIRYMSWPGMAYEDSERAELLDPFEQENPGVKVKLELIPYGEFWTKMAALAAADDLPDFFSMCVLQYGSWTPKGVLLDLEPFIEAELDASKYYTELWEMLRRAGAVPSLYALPFRGVIEVMAFNKDAFAAAGVPEPDNKDWAWEDLLDTATQLTVTDDSGKISQYGYVSTHSHQVLDAAIVSNGGAVLDESLKRCLLDSPVAIETIQFFVDMIHKHKVAPNPADVEGMGDLFLTGRVALQPILSYQVQPYMEIEDFQYDIWWMPRGTVKQAAYGGPDSMSISKSTRYKDECLRLMKFALSEKRGVMSFGAGSIPSLKSKAESAEWMQSGGVQNKSVILEQIPYMTADFGPGWSEWRSNVMNNELALAWLGEKPVPEVVKAAASAIQAVLDDVWKGR